MFPINDTGHAACFIGQLKEFMTILGQGMEWTSLQWGAWSGVGMAASSPALLARLKRQVCQIQRLIRQMMSASVPPPQMPFVLFMVSSK